MAGAAGIKGGEVRLAAAKEFAALVQPLLDGELAGLSANGAGLRTQTPAPTYAPRLSFWVGKPGLPSGSPGLGELSAPRINHAHNRGD
jgi:hypothetical protein